MATQAAQVTAKPRAQLGSRANKRLRDQGLVPGVIYGPGPRTEETGRRTEHPTESDPDRAASVDPAGPCGSKRPSGPFRYLFRVTAGPLRVGLRSVSLLWHVPSKRT